MRCVSWVGCSGWPSSLRSSPRTVDTPAGPRSSTASGRRCWSGRPVPGALQALFEAGITPDVVVGCSVGALNAAFVAVAPTRERVHELEQVWRGMSRQAVFHDGRFTVARRLAARGDHLYSADALRALIADCVPVVDLGDTAVPCHVVTTDLLAG